MIDTPTLPGALRSLLGDLHGWLLRRDALLMAGRTDDYTVWAARLAPWLEGTPEQPQHPGIADVARLQEIGRAVPQPAAGAFEEALASVEAAFDEVSRICSERWDGKDGWDTEVPEERQAYLRKRAATVIAAYLAAERVAADRGQP